MELSIVVPVYNSSSILSELCSQLVDALSDIDIEIILVDDGSQDSSWRVIKQLAEQIESVQGFRLTRNFGQDNAIMAGLNNSSGVYVVIMDDDLQHSPYDILTLLDYVKENESDVCYADYSDGKYQAWWKNLGSYLNSKQAEYLIGKPGEIYLSPFKVISRLVVDSVVNYNGPYPYVDGLIFQSTSSITQISVKHNSRELGRSNYSFRKSLSVFMSHTTGFSVVPLRIASISGLIMAVLGFTLGIYYIYDYFISETRLEGWTTLAVLILFIGGMILLSLGMIGEYLGRMYLTNNKRPQFLVHEVTS